MNTCSPPVLHVLGNYHHCHEKSPYNLYFLSCILRPILPLNYHMCFICVREKKTKTRCENSTYRSTHESQLAHATYIILILKPKFCNYWVCDILSYPSTSQTLSLSLSLSLPSKTTISRELTLSNHSSFAILLSFLKPMDMEISHVVEDKINEDMSNSPTLLSSKSCVVSSQNEYTEQEVEPGSPHEALFLVIAYLPLFELLAMSEVCVSLRDAVQKDALPWLKIIVERPLSLRLSDEILKKITSKATGRLKTLVLMNCEKITDDGLQQIIRKNPRINKVWMPKLISDVSSVLSLVNLLARVFHF